MQRLVGISVWWANRIIGFVTNRVIVTQTPKFIFILLLEFGDINNDKYDAVQMTFVEQNEKYFRVEQRVEFGFGINNQVIN